MQMSDLNLLQISENMASSGYPAYTFDPASQQVINSLPAVHQSHAHVTATINEIANSVASASENGRTAMRNGLTYDQFLAGLLYQEEVMLVGQYLYFDHLIFNPEKESPPRANMTMGRAFLTNHRLLFLSAEVYQGLSLQVLAPGKDKKPSGYTVTGRASDVLHYQSIPLPTIHSVELNASVGIQSTGSVFGSRPCYLLAALSCCGMDACLKSWSSGAQAVTSATNERTLTMGVTMPPWGHRYIVQLHLNGGVPMALVKEYIVSLTRFAPHVTTKAQIAAF